MSERPTSHDDFEVAVICALPLEANAVQLLFEDEWTHMGQERSIAEDANNYELGSIGAHNTVVVVLPGMGKTYASAAAASLNARYGNLRLALLIGICGGAPSQSSHGDDVLLSDVIGDSVIQYDFGRQYLEQFLPKSSVKDSLGRLPKDLRYLLKGFETDRGRERLEQQTAFFLEELQKTYGARQTRQTRRRRFDRYKYPGTSKDKLFEPHYCHRHHGSATCCGETYTCEAALVTSYDDLGCDESHLVPRADLSSTQDPGHEDLLEVQQPRLHIGPVASGDTVMKSGEDRDRLARKEGILAFEMEGAGAWDEIPCIVVKGVCDYADSHKDKRWQDFAAVTAAAAM